MSGLEGMGSLYKALDLIPRTRKRRKEKKKKVGRNWTCRCTPVIPAPRRRRQGAYCEFKARLKDVDETLL